MAIANITGNILTDSGISTSSLLPLSGGTMTGQIVLKEGATSTDYTKGLRFPNDPYGGSGDVAGMRLYSSSGENMVLELYTGNDVQDVINFATGVGGTANNDTVTINGNRIWNAGNLTPQTQLNGTGFVKASGTTISYDNSTYLTTSAASSTYVPYTGALSDVNLGTRAFSAGNILGTTLNASQNSNTQASLIVGNAGTFRIADFSNSGALVAYITNSGSIFGSSFVKSGGSSNQFLKADGSVDSTSYFSTSGGIISGNIYMQSSGNPSQLLAKGVNTEFWVDSQYGGGTARAFINRNGVGNQATLMFSTGVVVTNGTAWAGVCDYSMGMTNDGTGNFYIGAGDLFSSGNRALTITSSKNVGIGTSSPVNTLTIQNTGENAIEWHRSNAMQGMIGIPSASNQIITGSALNNFCFRATTQMLFATGGDNERMRITSGGTIALNGSSDVTNVNERFTMGYFVGNYGWLQTWDSKPLYFNKLGNAVYAGTQRIDNNSDARIKDNIESISGALDTILSLKGRKFNMLDENGKLRYGFVAQEVQPYLNDFVTESDRTFEKDDVKIEKLLTLESSGASWAALLVEAIKEQQAQIEELKQLINK